ncbi:MAG: 3-deoxy-7-phosphoheptulonate synthase [Myxococcales bacterium]
MALIIAVKRGADPEHVRRELSDRGLWVTVLEGGAGVVFLVEPHSARLSREALLQVEGVDWVAERPASHPRVDAQPPVLDVFGTPLGAGAPAVLMAGPCCVESERQIQIAAEAVARAGGRFLRGGAYKPRTSPYSFQGHGEPALRWLRRAADEHGLKVVTEVLRTEDVPRVAEYAQLVQIGSRNMQNFPLLAETGRTGRILLLKRAVGATVEEWLLAAEHCLVHGAQGVIFCERGIRSFDPSVRNLLDLGSVALLAHVLHQPVIVDPSHACGRRDLVAPLSAGALAAGAHGLLVETHPAPGEAQSDGPQALTSEELLALGRSLGAV